MRRRSFRRSRRGYRVRSYRRGFRRRPARTRRSSRRYMAIGYRM